MRSISCALTLYICLACAACAVAQSRPAEDDSSGDTTATELREAPSAEQLLDFITSQFTLKRPIYARGEWFRVKPRRLRVDSTGVDERVLGCVQKLTPDSLDYPAFVCDSIVSPYFRSIYYAFIGDFTLYTNWPSMCGFVAWRPSDNRYTPFVRQLMPPPLSESPFFLVNLYPEETLEYLQADLDTAALNGGDTVSAAMDIVTIISVNFPVFFVRDYIEILKLEKLFESEPFWEYAEVEDSLAILLSKVRLELPLDNEMFGDPYLDHYLLDVALRPELDAMHAPSVVAEDDTEKIVELFAWSPDGGRVIQWRIHFHRDGTLSEEWKILGHYYGFQFKHGVL